MQKENTILKNWVHVKNNNYHQSELSSCPNFIGKRELIIDSRRDIVKTSHDELNSISQYLREYGSNNKSGLVEIFINTETGVGIVAFDAIDETHFMRLEWVIRETSHFPDIYEYVELGQLTLHEIT